MTTLEFNATIVNVVGFTMITIFIIAWVHATYTDLVWRRQEREWVKEFYLREWTKIQASRNTFERNTIL
jgi:hypothetical protein